MPINARSIFEINVQSSQKLTEWLSYQASLTDKLQKLNGDVRLEVISQRWENPDWWDKTMLQIEKDLVFKRDILMRSHNIPYWYARSVIPQQCYERDPIFFDRLKNESIKNLIFGNDKVQRINGITYPIDHHCIEFYWVKKKIDTIEGILWVRLTEYSFQQSESFYIIEILLQELEYIL